MTVCDLLFTPPAQRGKRVAFAVGAQYGSPGELHVLCHGQTGRRLPCKPQVVGMPPCHLHASSAGHVSAAKSIHRLCERCRDRTSASACHTSRNAGISHWPVTYGLFISNLIAFPAVFRLAAGAALAANSLYFRCKHSSNLCALHHDSAPPDSIPTHGSDSG